MQEPGDGQAVIGKGYYPMNTRKVKLKPEDDRPLSAGKYLVLLDDVNRDSIEHGFVNQFEIVEEPKYYYGILDGGEVGDWITIRVRRIAETE